MWEILFQTIKCHSFDSSNSLTLPECACNKDGSIDSTCDITSGHCSCIDNVGGDKCDTCHNGWYDFPSCQGELYYKKYPVN